MIIKNIPVFPISFPIIKNSIMKITKITTQWASIRQNLLPETTSEFDVCRRKSLLVINLFPTGKNKTNNTSP